MEKIKCIRCKKEINIMREDYLHIKKEWGYFSNKDGELHEFSICETCYDDMIRNFIPIIPGVNITDVSEMI